MTTYPTSQVGYVRSLSARHLAMILCLIGAAAAQAKYGCQVDVGSCGQHGFCEKFGFCTCQEGFYGEKCDSKMNNPALKTDLSKGFITFWVIFWVLINFLIPYLICLMITYLQKKNCDRIKEHFNDCREAFCCCFKKRETFGTVGADDPAVEVLAPAGGANAKRNSLLEVADANQRDEQLGPSLTTNKEQGRTNLAGNLPSLALATNKNKPSQNNGNKPDDKGSSSKLDYSLEERKVNAPAPYAPRGLMFNNQNADDVIGPDHNDIVGVLADEAIQVKQFQVKSSEKNRLEKFGEGKKHLLNQTSLDKFKNRIKDKAGELKITNDWVDHPENLKDELISAIKFK